MDNWPVVSDNPDIQSAYVRMRESGQSHTIAEILAVRSFPGIQGTDSQFMRGWQTGNQWDHCRKLGRIYVERAEQAGISISGKRYLGGLASYPGDPKAWVSGQSDVLRVARERKLRVEGLVNYDPGEVEPSPDIPLAPDIIDETARSIREMYPDLSPEEAREKAFNLRKRGESQPVVCVDESRNPQPPGWSD